MAVVKEFMHGNVRIRILDDVCKDSTDEELEAALKRIAKNVYPYLLAQHEQKLREEQEKQIQ